jgi:hypothetical protein
MAFPTPVNDLITDAVAQANLQVIGSAPSVAMADLYQASAQALALAAQNAVFAQQQMNATSQAATAAGVALILGAVPK